MKKLFFLTALIVCGCVNPLTQSPDDLVKKVSFTVASYNPMLDEEDSFTKTAIDNDYHFIWAEGDTVGIYPNTGSQVYFVIDNPGSSYADFDGGGWAFKYGASYYSYYPFIGNIYLDRTRIPISYVGQKQIGTSSTSHIGKYDYMWTPATSAETGSLKFHFDHLGCVVVLFLSLPSGSYGKVAITAADNRFVKNGYFDLTSESPVIVPTEYTNQLIVDLEDFTLAEPMTVRVFIMMAPVNLTGESLTVSILDSEKKEYQCLITPTREYVAGSIYGLTCSSWTEVPQSTGLIIQNWTEGSSIIGTVE